MKHKQILIITVLLFVAFACNFNKNESETGDFEPLTEIPTDVPDYAKFAMKSGVIEMESVTMGMKQNIMMYFDDWGQMVANEIHMSVLGQKTHIVSIIKDGWSYEIDMIKKQGRKVKIDMNAYDQINYLKMDDQMMKDFNITFIGDVEILGRQCKEYELNMKEQGLKAKTAVWNGIALRSEASVMGMSVKINVTKIQENVEIPAEKFEIPDDIEFIEEELTQMPV
jgi:hypothetical protein